MKVKWAEKEGLSPSLRAHTQITRIFTLIYTVRPILAILIFSHLAFSHARSTSFAASTSTLSSSTFSAITMAWRSTDTAPDDSANIRRRRREATNPSRLLSPSRDCALFILLLLAPTFLLPFSPLLLPLPLLLILGLPLPPLLPLLPIAMRVRAGEYFRGGETFAPLPPSLPPLLPTSIVVDGRACFPAVLPPRGVPTVLRLNRVASEVEGGGIGFDPSLLVLPPCI
mmetsp:Transcript_18372/g.46060  ORF Transcript_18372/g.46060 Transcript_18372/m.46060 type:complete len:227 (-) Transcript_18372:1334-2014(-)